MPKAAPAQVASLHGGTALAPLPKVPSRRRPLVSEIRANVPKAVTFVND
jgi:hypothetical protein